MTRIWAATTSRADYGIYLPLLRALRADRRCRLGLLVSGMHLSPDFGLTVRAIEADGFEIAARVEMLLAGDSPESVSKSTGVGILGCAQAFAHGRPDLLLVLGDRFEMHAVALAALPFQIPVAHIHGGELTAGAIDDALRHSLTKLCHLHYVSTRGYAQRVRQLGEEPWRICVSGALGLDQLRATRLLDKRELETALQLRLERPPFLVTFHPATLEHERSADHARELLAALAGTKRPVVFTATNADPGGRAIADAIRAFVATHPEARLFENLGSVRYFSLMRLSAAMIGNSSSGLIEGPALRLPVVNVGSRQDGRVRGANVIDVPCDRLSIERGIRRALEPRFKRRLRTARNPYGNGGAAPRIVAHLFAALASRRPLLRKRFVDRG